MTQGSIIEHNKTLDDLIIRVSLWHPQAVTIPNFMYSGNEADLLQYEGITPHIVFRGYEVKCHDNHAARRKAFYQLARLESYLNRVLPRKVHEIKCFYVAGCEDNYFIEDVKTGQFKTFEKGVYDNVKRVRTWQKNLQNLS